MSQFNRGASTNMLHIISDCLFGIFALLTSIVLSDKEIIKNNLGTCIAICAVFLTIYVLSNKDSRMYNVTTFFYKDRVLKYISKSFLIATVITATMFFYVARTSLIYKFYLQYLFFIYLYMMISAICVRILVKKKKLYMYRTILVGDNNSFSDFERYVGKCNLNIDIIGYVSKEEGGEGYLGTIQDLERIVHANAIDQVYFMHTESNGFDIQSHIDLCVEMGVTAKVIMDMYKNEIAHSYVSSVGTYPVITYHTVSLNTSARVLKRCIDIIGSIVGIILSTPFLLITAIAIKIDSKGPIIFKQKRVGLNGRYFYMYKFRSMCNDAEEQKLKLLDQNEMQGGIMFKMQNDPRITPVGKFIRKTSLDELPQFFNVLKGDMSLVGTRPPTIDEVLQYQPNHWRRMSIKPGITGMWQVSGRSSVTDFQSVVDMDTEYIDCWNIFVDFKIIFKTIWKVLGGDGAY
ncbi:sugar transferase [Clostridium sp. Marseille-P299]|uniref:sugar transferase n=1 Tax=Clostridium sp. Marseille-P299 TaxID=1805477 RepID=UPI00082CDED2|nr:sugar transferase [Clostridium sp. Marseille-P299]